MATIPLILRRHQATLVENRKDYCHLSTLIPVFPCRSLAPLWRPRALSWQHEHCKMVALMGAMRGACSLDSGHWLCKKYIGESWSFRQEHVWAPHRYNGMHLEAQQRKYFSYLRPHVTYCNTHNPVPSLWTRPEASFRKIFLRWPVGFSPPIPCKVSRSFNSLVHTTWWGNPFHRLQKSQILTMHTLTCYDATAGTLQFYEMRYQLAQLVLAIQELCLLAITFILPLPCIHHISNNFILAEMPSASSERM